MVQTVLGEEIVEEGVEPTGEERVYAPGQSNVNTAETTFNGSQTSIDAGATGDVAAGIAQIDGLDLSLQGQLVGQLNLSGQGGLAIATALSDPVTVYQFRLPRGRCERHHRHLFGGRNGACDFRP